MSLGFYITIASTLALGTTNYLYENMTRNYSPDEDIELSEDIKFEMYQLLSIYLSGFFSCLILTGIVLMFMQI